MSRLLISFGCCTAKSGNVGTVAKGGSKLGSFGGGPVTRGNGFSSWGSQVDNCKM